MTKKRLTWGAMALLLGCTVLAEAQTSAQPAPGPLSFSLAPSFSIPIGRDTALYTVGGGAVLSGEYRIPSLPLVFVGGNLAYSYVPLQEITTLSLMNAGVAAGVRYDILSNLSVSAYGTGGYYYAFLNDGSGDSGSNPFIGLGAGVSWTFMPSLSAGLGLSYRDFAGLYNDIAVSLGMAYNLPQGGFPAAKPAVEQKPLPAQPKPLTVEPKPQPKKVEERDKGILIYDLSFNSVFPIFHAWYDSNAIGKLTLKNTDSSTANDVTVSLIIKQYMDAAKESITIPALKPGEERSVDLLALFKNNILEITQTTKVAAEVNVSYTRAGKPASLNKVETVTVYDRNAMTWDDNQKAAAFVTPKEPVVLFFSNNVNAIVKGKTNRVIDKNLQTAITFHDALRLYGITYVSPPLTSYAVVSKNKQAVDSLKFPRETFAYRSGDCSDLAILYCSLLESVQIETAFITVPGHIFMAVALEMSEEEARQTFTRTDELIFREGKVWVPIEVTEREGSFMTAWQVGAKEWRENLLKKQADFYPVRTAWHTYEAVFFPGSGNPPLLPDAAKVVKDFQADLSDLVSREIFNREGALKAAVARSATPKNVNALGLLYARYDLTEKAEAQFQTVLAKSEYAPALVNLGNLYYLKGDFEKASAFYQRAYKQAPHNATVLLCLARVNHEQQNYGSVKKMYAELKTLNPDLASQFAYLDLQGEEATRAADVSKVKDIVLWEEVK